MECYFLLSKYYNRDGEIGNIDHCCIETFIENDLNNEYETFGGLYDCNKWTSYSKHWIFKTIKKSR